MSFITGGTGFIGSHLVRELVKRGDEVVIFSRSPNTNAIKDVVDVVKIFRGDVSEIIDVLRALKENAIERIVHLAAFPPLMAGPQRDPHKAIKVNCLGTCNIFEAARIAGVKRVVWASSRAVIGSAKKGEIPLDEDDPVKPTNVYGACKLLNELIAKAYNELYGLDTIGLRFPLVYGPGRGTRSEDAVFSSELVENPAMGKPVKVSYGDQLYDWLYVADAVKAIILACDVKETRHKIFNICGHRHTVREAAKIVKECLPEAIIKVEPGEVGLNYLIDMTRAHEELGYTPSYTLRKGIQEYINYIRDKKIYY